jgi:tyrosyl-tRNA synthetase
MDDIKAMERDMKNGTLNPRDAKARLAREFITMFHGQEQADQAEARFKTIFSKGDIPEDIPEYRVKESPVWVPKLLADAGLVASTSEARRMIKQGGVKFNGDKWGDEDASLEVVAGMVVQVGKRKFARLVR